MSRLLVTARRHPGDPNRRPEPDWPVDRELERGSWHDDNVAVWVEAPFGTSAANLLAERGQWLVAFSGWVTTSDTIDAPLTAGEIASRLDRAGTGMLAHLAGEHLLFALHIPSSRWWLVRDAAGVQPGLWAQGDELLALGTGAGEVSTSAGLPKKPDLDYLAKLLAWGPSSGTDTPLTGLVRLPGGQILHGRATDASAPVASVWWTPPPPGSQPEPTVDELRDVYRRVVRGRLAAVGPDVRIAVELSGGLDSTLIAALAREIIPTERLVAVVQLHGGRGSTDLPYARAAAQALELELVEDTWVPRTAEQLMEECEGGARIPISWNGTGEDFGVARRSGAGLLLRGVGGDEYLGGSSLALNEVLLRRPGASLRALSENRQPLSWLGSAVRAQCRSWLVSSVGHTRALDHLRHHRLKSRAPWLPTHVLRRLEIEDLVQRRPSPASTAAAAHRRWVHSDAWITWALEAYLHDAARSGVAWGLPFYDRPAIEASLAVPELARWQGGDWRGLSRRLLPATVPDLVRGRTDKAESSEMAYEEAIWAPLGPAATWRTVALDLCRPEPVQRCLDRTEGREIDPWASWRLAGAEWVVRAMDAADKTTCR